MKRNLIWICLLAIGVADAQTMSSRSNEIPLNFAGSGNRNSSIPKISWIEPENEISFLKDGKFIMRLEVESKHPLKSIFLKVINKETNETKGSSALEINGVRNLSTKIERDIALPDGISVLEITAENVNGLKSITRREIHVGITLLADAAKMGRKDYALIFASDMYDNWSPLSNPIFDGNTIGSELQKVYGFQTDIVENPTQEQVLLKLREYAEKRYNSFDQLFIFFAGHGFYDETLKEGFVVTKESLQNDPGTTSYLRHSSLRSTINNNPCEHILLVMDVCFGGSFDEIMSTRGELDVYGETSQAELIARKLQFKTRKYLTSGGKEYVSDGVAGLHSPFAKQLIEGLNTRGGNDGILTMSELMTHLETLKTAPQFGRFGMDKQGSEFVFVVK